MYNETQDDEDDIMSSDEYAEIRDKVNDINYYKNNP